MESKLKIAYLDCQSGISGDMFLAACVDAGADFQTIQNGIDSLKTGNCNLEQKDVKKFGFRALKIDVLHEPEHAHRHLHHINDMIDASTISSRQKELAKQIFLNLAKAEAQVHGSTLEKVHFHEVGAIDSIADIVGGAIAWDLLGIDQLYCSPIPTGKGQISIAHGLVSVPAPATAELLKGIPIQKCDIECELTTPTGAAIVSTLAREFGSIPEMNIEKIGIGAGTKDLDEQANVLRLLVGQSEGQIQSDQVLMLETNLDDISSEAVGYCQQRLWDAGALDVYTVPIQMKKSWPGTMLCVLCHNEQANQFKEIVFNETGTLGIRHRKIERSILSRSEHFVDTDLGRIDGKLVTMPNGSSRFVPEYESCAKLASESGKSLHEVFQLASNSYFNQ